MLVAREMNSVLCGARYADTRNLVRDVLGVATMLPQDPCTANVLLATRLQQRASQIVRCSSLMIKP